MKSRDYILCWLLSLRILLLLSIFFIHPKEMGWGGGRVRFLSQSSSIFLGKLVPYHQIKKRETEVISLLNVVNRCDHALEFKKNHLQKHRKRKKRGVVLHNPTRNTPFE